MHKRIAILLFCAAFATVKFYGDFIMVYGFLTNKKIKENKLDAVTGNNF